MQRVAGLSAGRFVKLRFAKAHFDIVTKTETGAPEPLPSPPGMQRFIMQLQLALCEYGNLGGSDAKLSKQA